MWVKIFTIYHTSSSVSTFDHLGLKFSSCKLGSRSDGRVVGLLRYGVELLSLGGTVLPTVNVVSLLHFTSHIKDGDSTQVLTQVKDKNLCETG